MNAVPCISAIKYNVENIKAYYRKAAALKGLSLYKRALQAAEHGRRQATSRPQEVCRKLARNDFLFCCHSRRDMFNQQIALFCLLPQYVKVVGLTNT